MKCFVCVVVMLFVVGLFVAMFLFTGLNSITDHMEPLKFYKKRIETVRSKKKDKNIRMHRV